MELRKFFWSLIVAGSVVQTVGLSSAFAGGLRADAGTNQQIQQCGPVLKMTSEEREKLMLLNAKLSYLEGTYGTAKFEPQLKIVTDEYYPSNQKLSSVTPTFFKRLDNRVAQERLRHLIAKTIGLSTREWLAFEGQMKAISIFDSGGGHVNNPLDKAATRLIQVIQESQKSASEKKLATAPFEEAYVSVAEMYAQLMELKAINGEISNAELGKWKSVAVAAIAAASGAVIGGTIKYGKPVVKWTGQQFRFLGHQVSDSLRTIRGYQAAGQIVGGSAVGLVGAPAVTTANDSFWTVTNAWVDSLNNNSSYGCELNKQMSLWADKFKDNTLAAMQIGAAFGAGGGALTLNPTAAKYLLKTTWAAILTAQGYSVAKGVVKGYQSYIYYSYAAEAEKRGDSELSDKFLRQARAAAQEAGHAALEAAIVATLTHHVGHHRREAFHKGAEEIRMLYATSADTIPTAFHAIEKTAHDTYPLMKMAIAAGLSWYSITK